MPGKRGRNKIPEFDKDRIVHLLDSTELNFVDIARRMGVNEATVSDINRVRGVRPSHRKPKPAAK